MIKTAVALFLFFIASFDTLVAGDTTALMIARKVADKVIHETSFAFRLVPQKPQLGLQVIDLRQLSLQENKVAYAFHRPTAVNDTLIYFGVNSGGKISIWINKQLVFQQHSGVAGNPKEIAYGRFKFNAGFSAGFKKGENEVLVRYEAGLGEPVIFLRPITETLDLNTAVRFDEPTAAGWLMAGFPASDKMIPEENGQPVYATGGKAISWQTAPHQFLPELIIDSNATYKRDSYADWNYANGATIWSMMLLGDKPYVDFVKKYSQFILSNNAFFKWQYDSLFAYRGSFHRIYRQSMLDDSGTPALPLVELNLRENDKTLKEFIDPIASYVFKEQLRLADGTFCRPEPINYTVWADDLFMSVPFLLRIARSSGDQKYYDDAALQVINFRKYLIDPATGLYKHGWFSHTKERSAVYWGRANGWIVWATAELLTWLPPGHPKYKSILQMFREHVTTLVGYQGVDGMWHQVLDRPDSYKETSCTALFTLAIARGVRMGWLPVGLKMNAVKGWDAVKKNIDADGTVHGICRGTEIGFDQTFYMNRPTIDHDPRGLGAVITAGVEMSKLK